MNMAQRLFFAKRKLLSNIQHVFFQVLCYQTISGAKPATLQTILKPILRKHARLLRREAGLRQKK